MPSIGKAKLGNGSVLGEGQCLTWENFLSFMVKVFDVKRSIYVFRINCLNQGCGVEKTSFQIPTPRDLIIPLQLQQKQIRSPTLT